MKFKIHFIYFLGLVLFGGIPPLYSQDCLSEGCHSELVSKRLVHLPTEEGDCESCHEQVKKNHPDRKGKEMALATDDLIELCTNCHMPYLDNPDLHPPVLEGECITCHNPHQSDQNKLLQGATAEEVCTQCHDDKKGKQPFVHGPVAVGACTACHSGHGNVSNALLRKGDVNSTCYDCHELVQKEITSQMNTHEPVEEDCTNCHDPHASENRFQLVEKVPTLCLDCHDDIDEIIAGTASQHDAVNMGETCLNCHLPHGSNYAKDLKGETFDLCLSCHDQPLKIGRITVPDMRKFLSRFKDWHGPVREKDCSGCHQPHGSENMRLLRFFYPDEFYAPFSAENYQLCFQCHSEENVLDSTTTRLTNFRDGSRNLHYLHVNREKGRTCRACHQTHASNRPFHIRESVPFGNWELPINYEPLENGGRCSPGCHQMREYHR